MCRDAALLCVRDFVHMQSDRYLSDCLRICLGRTLATSVKTALQHHTETIYVPLSFPSPARQRTTSVPSVSRIFRSPSVRWRSRRWWVEPTPCCMLLWTDGGSCDFFFKFMCHYVLFISFSWLADVACVKQKLLYNSKIINRKRWRWRQKMPCPRYAFKIKEKYFKTLPRAGRWSKVWGSAHNLHLDCGGQWLLLWKSWSHHEWCSVWLKVEKK